jgi:hypothetical protein
MKNGACQRIERRGPWRARLQLKVENATAAQSGLAPLATDLLILCDGTVLAHNLTPAMAAVLHKLNPQDETMWRRSVPARAQPAFPAANHRAATPQFRD